MPGAAQTRTGADPWFGARCAHVPPGPLRTGARTGPLAGLRFAAKDLIAVNGVTACAGQPQWLATHGPADRDASVIASLLAAGATLEALTITDELALSLTGENAHFGTPRNPAALGRVPGGSSSGSAVAVACGAVDFALGTDTGGSVRVPASHCGVFGMRPSHAAVSTEGLCPLARSFDTVGWFARDADTLERVGRVLLPPDRRTSAPAELFVPSDVEALLDPEAVGPFREAAQRLAKRLGHRPVPCELGGAGVGPLTSWLTTYLTLQNQEAREEHAAWIREARPVFGSLIGRRVARVLSASDADELRRAREHRACIRERLEHLLGEHAWLLLPSAPGPAPPLGQPDDAVDAFTGRGLTLAAAASLAGLPQISVPLATVPSQDGALPLGISIVAPAGTDRALLAALSPHARRPT